MLQEVTVGQYLIEKSGIKFHHSTLNQAEQFQSVQNGQKRLS